MIDERSRLEFLKQIENEVKNQTSKESTVLSQLKINKYVDEQKDKIIALDQRVKESKSRNS